MLIAAFAAASFLCTTLGGYGAHGPILELRESHEPLWTVEIWCGGDQRLRDRKGRLSQQFVAILYVDPKAKDPLSGRLLVDELKEAIKSNRIMAMQFQRMNGYGVLTMVRPDRPERYLEIVDVDDKP